MAIQMIPQNAIQGGQAECFITVAGRRLNFMSLKEFEATYSPTIEDVPVLGSVNMRHKTAGGTIEWSATAYYNQSTLRVVMDAYQKTGFMPYCEIQVTNHDLTSTVGRQTILLHGVLFDSMVLTKLAAGEGILEEEISGTADSWNMPERFAEMPGV